MTLFTERPPRMLHITQDGYRQLSPAYKKYMTQYDRIAVTTAAQGGFFVETANGHIAFFDEHADALTHAHTLTQ